MKQIILPSTIGKFTWLVIDGLTEENELLATRKIFSPHKKYLRVEEGVYTMQSMDKNTEYQKLLG